MLELEFEREFTAEIVSPKEVKVYYKGNYIIALKSQEAAKKFIDRAIIELDMQALMRKHFRRRA